MRWNNWGCFPWQRRKSFGRVIHFRFGSGFCFRSEFHFWNNAYSTAFPYAWPIATIDEVGSTRLTSLECVTIRASDRHPGPPAEKWTRLAGCHNPYYLKVRFPWPSAWNSLLTGNRKMPENSGNDSRCNKCNVLYHNTMLKTALPTSCWSNWRKPKPFQ